ncbi:hypothetical protein ASG29_06470 [Sphingomonas sp. Leaf412]|nr:hypothetical protein ASG29_06470 [Sphingomonas sp. Leaf412]
MLRDLWLCERRAHHDLHSPPAKRDPTSPFVEMLWASGVRHEARILAELPGAVADLREVPRHLRAGATQEAMAGRSDTILGATLASADRIGMPDILLRGDVGWTAADVKAGSPLQPDGRRPKVEYAVQVAHYADLLRTAGHGDGTTAIVIGADGERTTYDLGEAIDRAGRTPASLAGELTDKARRMIGGDAETRGALSAACGLCKWRTACTAELEALDDLSLIAGLGRSLRDAIAPAARTVLALADLDVGTLAARGERTALKGVGRVRLERFQDRARLLKTPGATPYARRPLDLPRPRRELHLDLEADPSIPLTYLHGILERQAGAEDRFVHFFADGPDGEREAFAAAMAHLTEDPSAVIYHYSAFEPVAYRALQRRHPSVCSPEDVEALFARGRAVDLLLHVVMPDTEWPTRNVSIKTLAKTLGFRWRDAEAGGAASIAWFAEYQASGDPAVRRRIVEYNHDDVVASAVLLDGLRALPVRGRPPWPPVTAPSSP